ISNDRAGLSRLLTKAINKQFNRKNESVIAINEVIARNVLLIFISRILEIDIKAAPFRIIALEMPVRFRMSVNIEGVRSEIWAGGIIDRVDEKDGITRIVDYKTGKVADSIGEIGELFREDRVKDSDGWLQTLLYCEGYLSFDPGAKARPSIYKIKSASGEEVNDRLVIKPAGKEGAGIDDYAAVRHEFMHYLQSAAEIILGSNEPFIMTNDMWSKCSYCPYRFLCKR
ncbi:MAG: PD-(D/E)XK nuclease family protein, partial [Bacteroidales bacterium]